MRSCDVLVAGGGSAGLAAAVASARLGARTLLVERHGSLGGMAPAALVHSICGLYELSTGPDPVIANRGFAEEFSQRLLGAGGAVGPIRMGRVDVLLQQPTAFAQLADAYARETPGLEVLFHTDLISLDQEGKAVLFSRGRSEAVEAKSVVDATGDGCVAALSGAAFEIDPPERLQRPAFIFSLQGVEEGAADDDRRLKIAARIATAVREERLPPGALGAALRASGRAGEIYVTIDLAGPTQYDPTDAATLSSLELEGRALAGALAAFLKSEAGGFRASFISSLPAQVGIRESRRITGRYRIEAADLAESANFEDAVAVAAWPIELRETNRGARLRYPHQGRPCDIPLRALRFRDLDHYFVAGRCISCSHEAQASIRVIGTCLATGEAAGFAAALQALNGGCDAAEIRAARERVQR
ncbi:MAG TPA: FAD-dependent oxidoreductase [Chthoniobacteraceae bacterium]|jgi:hypothetical protein